MVDARQILGWATVAVVAVTAHAWGAEGCCDHCGKTVQCRKVCHLKTEEKKVEVTCWGSKCEPFCVPGPSERGCQHCETVCQQCQTDDPTVPYAEPKRFLWSEWRPGCAEVHYRKKLMKKTVTVKVPTHKWVVEDLCTECCAQCKVRSDKPTVAERLRDDDAAARE